MPSTRRSSSSRAQRWSSTPGLLHAYPTRLMLSLVGCLLLLHGVVWLPIGDYVPRVGWRVQHGSTLGLDDLTGASVRLPVPTAHPPATPVPVSGIAAHPLPDAIGADLDDGAARSPSPVAVRPPAARPDGIDAPVTSAAARLAPLHPTSSPGSVALNVPSHLAPLKPDPPSSSTLTSFIYYDEVDEKPRMWGGLGDLYLRLHYPLEARRRGIEGRMRIAFTVDTDGTTRDLEVVQPVHWLLDTSALETMKHTRFAPGRRDGQAVPVRMSIPIHFVLIYPASPIATAKSPSP